MATVQPRRFSGTRDFLPSDMIPREEMFARLREVFAHYGYDPLETPAIEYLDVLSGKYGPEADKLLYRLDYKTDGKDAAGLRYDLTVPLARVAAMAAAELPLPFRRYQMQPVWRAERAQTHKGRYREFYQCDVDCVGTTSTVADAEIVAMISDSIAALGISGAIVKLNSRKLLRGMALALGLADREAPLLRCLDKYDKIGLDGVREEMTKSGFTPDEFSKTASLFVSADEPLVRLSRIESSCIGIPGILEGAQEIREVLEHSNAMGAASGSIQFDPLMVRGLDYYTGPIFEAVLPSLPHMGSLAGGGRYDGLIGMFLGRPVPATGATVGLDRIFTALEQLNLVNRRKTRAIVLVALFSAEMLPVSLKLAADLRGAGLNVVGYAEADKLKKQFKYADDLGIRFVVLVGPDEAQAGTASLKDLLDGTQITVPMAEIGARVKEKTGR
ncbi:MAG: histidine--tRNA ligase [Candidatus Brocadiia bacterium]